MPEWWTYGLDDAQVHSARAYAQLVAHCNAQARTALWMVLAIGGAVALLLLRRYPHAARALGGAAALACAGSAAWWLPRCYAGLHWAAEPLALGFGLQAVLLVAWALRPGTPPPGPRAHALALLLWVVGLAGLPAGQALGGAAWPTLEWPGLQAAPSALAALAVLPLASARWRWILAPLPLAGLLFDGLTRAATAAA